MTVNVEMTMAAAASTFMAAHRAARATADQAHSIVEALPEYFALQAAQAALQATPEHKAAMAAEAAAAAAREAIKTGLAGTKGVQETAFGKVGYQPALTYTYRAASVKAIAPDLAALVVTETVDGKTLEKFVATAIKTEKLPADALEQLRAAASVKEVLSWIFKPCDPEAEAIAPRPPEDTPIPF
jgi:hypothetical protein